MPKLKPLEEWVCDTCGEIVTVEGGWLEWLSGDDNHKSPHSFKIVHHRRECQCHANSPNCNDTNLSHFVGARGLQYFLSMLDAGTLLDREDERRQDRLPELRSFVDTVRRLHIPYYEEARRYFSQAREDGWFMDNNEVAIHLPETNKSIIERYEGHR